MKVIGHQFRRCVDVGGGEFAEDVMVAVDSNAILPDMLEAFERYLRACGYVFTGQLDFVEDGP